MNQFFKYRDNQKEPKKFEAEIPVVVPEPVVEEPTPTPEPQKQCESALTDKQVARLKRHWTKAGMSVADQAENICNLDFCKQYILKKGYNLENF